MGNSNRKNETKTTIFKLKTPYEFLRAGANSYVLTRNIFARVADADRDDSSKQISNILEQQVNTNDPLERFRITLLVRGLQDSYLKPFKEESKKVGFSQTTHGDLKLGPQPSGRLPIALVIDLTGNLPSPTEEHYGFLTLHYFFDLLYRYRSSIYWPNSGRPCPACIRSLFDTQLTWGRRRLQTIGRHYHQANVSPFPGVRAPTFFEAMACIGDALRLRERLIAGDAHAIDGLREAEIVDLKSGVMTREIFPVDPSCIHKGFTT